jgi:hypothetical protein
MGGGDWINQAQQVQKEIIVNTPDVIVNIPKEETNYWWLLLIAIVPVVAGYVLRKKKNVK